MASFYDCKSQSQPTSKMYFAVSRECAMMGTKLKGKNDKTGWFFCCVDQ
jgi:hypothetical protein